MTPSWRKPAGALLMLLLIALWAVLVTSLAGTITGWPALGQALFYLVTGLLWILPMKPLLRWMETGRWRAGE